jgi:hypothetical protein
MVGFMSLAAYVTEDGLSMGGEALGPVKVLCSSIGECQGQEAVVGQLMRGAREEGIGGFLRRN